MRTWTTILLIFAVAAGTITGAETLKTPTGCVAADNAKPGPEGYADRVIHQKTGIELILIASGTFVMGTDDPQAASNVAPAYEVTIAQPFYMGKTEVSNGQYRRFMQAQPDYNGEADVDPAYDLYLLHFKDKSVMSSEDEYPVVWVGWHNAMVFCAWAGLQLPSEAQWEYACRAGTTTAYSFGGDEENLHDYAWADLAAEHLTHPVATKLPNPWGLHDMHGNVWEWCADDYIYRYENAPSDGSVRRDPKAQTKPLRGGSWSTGPGVNRETPAWFYSTAMGSVARFHVAPGNAWQDRGFRVILPLKGTPLKVPDGCTPSPGAQAGAAGYADRIIHGKTGMELILVATGELTMGSGKQEYQVAISTPFYMGKSEVTNAQYRRFVKASGYDGKPDVDPDPDYDMYLRHWRGKSIMSAEDDYPIVWVSWKNAGAFCSWAGLALPSESQWEYACRAGTATAYYFGDDLKEFDKYGWANSSRNYYTHPVAGKVPNGWGFHDMLGNVFEWVEDDYIGHEYFDKYGFPPTDGTARLEGKMTKVLKGGSWGNGPIACQSGSRHNSAPTNASSEIGFRAILSLDKQEEQ